MPVLAAGIALSAVGTGLSMAANAQDQSAIDKARSSYAKAQTGYQNEAGNLFNNNLPNQTAQTASNQIAQGAQQRQNTFRQLQQLTQPQSPAPGTPSSPTGGAMARSDAQSNAWGNAVSEAQSRLGGYGDWATALGVANSDVNNKIGVINNKARGRANILPIQIEAASHSGDALGSWGRIVGALGSLTSAYGANAGAWGSGGVSNIAADQAPAGGRLYGTVEPGDV